MTAKDDNSFQRVLFGLAENTGMHGLPNIQRSKSIVRKLFWLLILCGGLGKEFPFLNLGHMKNYIIPIMDVAQLRDKIRLQNKNAFQ